MGLDLTRSLTLVVAAGLCAPALAEPREIKGSTEAKGIKTLRLEAHVGSVEIRGTDADQISWTLKLEPDTDDGWFSGGRKDAQKAVDGERIETNRSFPVGAGLAVSKDGEDDIEGRVNVGEVSVRVE
jgi:hypothetical protein